MKIMINATMVSHPPPKTFYLLDYFYILLKSAERNSFTLSVFEEFKRLKHEHNLGESKYKTLSVAYEDLSIVKENRYYDTYKGVIKEAREYGLVETTDDAIELTPRGNDLLLLYQNEGALSFYQSLFIFMEMQYEGFRQLIQFCTKRIGLGLAYLFFPYTPRVLCTLTEKASQPLIPLLSIRRL